MPVAETSLPVSAADVEDVEIVPRDVVDSSVPIIELSRATATLGDINLRARGVCHIIDNNRGVSHSSLSLTNRNN